MRTLKASKDDHLNDVVEVINTLCLDYKFAPEDFRRMPSTSLERLASALGDLQLKLRSTRS